MQGKWASTCVDAPRDGHTICPISLVFHALIIEVSYQSVQYLGRECSMRSVKCQCCGVAIRWNTRITVDAQIWRCDLVLDGSPCRLIEFGEPSTRGTAHARQVRKLVVCSRRNKKNLRDETRKEHVLFPKLDLLYTILSVHFAIVALLCWREWAASPQPPPSADGSYFGGHTGLLSTSEGT